MKRRILFVCAAFVFLFTALFAGVVQAAPEISESKLKCNAYMLFDQDTGVVMYKSDTYQDQIAPASTTKILTAVIALEELDLSEEITVGSEVTAFKAGSSLMGLKDGETLTVKDLLYGMMLVSGNDAAAALAVHMGGSISGFAEKMNAKAAELAMEHSHFVNPHGMDAEEHYVTLEDMAKLVRYAVTLPDLMAIVGSKSYTVPKTNKQDERVINNTNRLIYKPEGEAESYLYKYATGLKTGSTPNGGGCVVATASHDGQNLVALVYGDPSDKGANRWGIAKTLLDYGFENYDNVTLKSLVTAQPITAKVSGAGIDRETVEIACLPDVQDDTLLTVDNTLGEGVELEARFEVANGGLEAPVQEGEVVGRVAYTYEDRLIYECNVLAGETVRSAEEEQLLNEGPISTIDPIELSDPKGGEIDPEKLTMLWWWALIPLALIVFLIVRAVLIKRKRHARRVQRANRRGVRSHRLRSGR